MTGGITKQKQTLVGGAIVLTAATLFTKLIGLIYRIPLNGILMEMGAGFYSSAYEIYRPIYTIAVTGLPFATAKILADYWEQRRYADIKKMRRVSLWFFAVIGLLGSLALFLLARPYVNFEKTPQVLYCIYAIAPSIFFSALMATYRGYNQGMKNMIPIAVSQAVEVVAKLAFGLLGAYLSSTLLTREYNAAGTVFGELMTDAVAARTVILSYSSAFAIFGVTLSVFAGYIYLLIDSRVRPNPITEDMVKDSPEPIATKKYILNIAKIAIPVTLSSLVSNITSLVDTVTIKRRLHFLVENSLEEFVASYRGLLDSIPPQTLVNEVYGSYTGISLVLFGLVFSLTLALNVSCVPFIASHWTARNYPALHNTQRQLLRFNMFISAPLGLGLLALATPISRLLFPTLSLGISITGEMTMVLAAAAIFSALNGSMLVMFNSIGRVSIPLYLTAGIAVFKISWNYFLVGVPSLNIRAASWGSLLAYVLVFLLSVVLIKKYTGVNLMLWQTFGKSLVAAAACGGAAYLMYALISPSLGNTISTLAAVLLGGCVYVALALVLKILKREDLDGMPGGAKIAALLEKVGALE